jgi:hypothetical protein
MSVQLILYPQSYNGQYNHISNVASEKLVDGISFNSINTSSSADISSTSPQAQIAAAPPNLMNTWYRSRSTVSGTPALPDATLGDLYLYSVVGTTSSGVYQKLSNLTVGQNYNLFLEFDNTASGQIVLSVYNGNTSALMVQSGTTITTLTASATWLPFTAQTTNDIVQINYSNSVVDTFKITGMSVIPVGQTVTYTNFHLEDGQVICDLYQEEDIPLTLSVDDFKNVAEKVQSYSKDFNLPATKRNNLIFDSIFEITRSDDGLIFNPYIKTQCVLKQDGYILFDGYLRLIDVQDQEGEISYNVNLYSEVVALADVLKDRTFADLDFTELEHEYNKGNIKNSWYNSPSVGITYTNPSTSGYRDANNTVKYPFVDWSHQILLSDGINGTINYPELTTLGQVFRPFIHIKYLINRIFQDTPFTWTSTFFDSTDFDKLFMDFNWGSAQEPNTNLGQGVGENDNTSGVFAYTTATRLRFDIEDFSSASELGYDNSTSKFTANRDNQFYYVQSNFVIAYQDPSPNSTLGHMGWEKFDALGVSTGYFAGYKSLQSIASSGNIQYSKTFTITLDSGESIRPAFIKYSSSTSVILEQRTTQQLGSFTPNQTTVTTGTSVITTEVLLENLRGELGQWDFLKGIMTMFNIISMPDKENPTNITFEPYADVFISDTAGTTLAARSIEHDWTDKVDVAEMKLLPLTDLNKKTIFKFVEDDDDYAFNLYKNSTSGHLYGSKKYDASAYTILEGEDEIVAEPFAATVPKALFAQFSDFITPAIFTANDEATEFEGFDNSPRIMYNNGKKTLGNGVTYFIPAQNGLSNEEQDEFLQFSHLSTIPTAAATLDFNFETHQTFSNIGTTPLNLFNLYWLPYYNELYNPNTRIMTMKVNLTPADINTFNFYDRVMIKNRSFRVNKIEYKPNDLATVEFILIP